GVEGVAVPAEAHVLGDVQARNGVERPVLEWKVEQVAHDRFEPLEIDFERPDVDEGDRADRGEEADQVDPGSDIDVPFGNPLGDPLGRPSVLVEVVLVEGRALRPVVELRVRLAPPDSLLTGEASVTTAVPQVAHVSASPGERTVDVDDWRDEA